MDCTSKALPSFSDMVEAAGERKRPLYPVTVVANVLAIPVDTILAETRAGRLSYFLPDGRRQGKLISPEWVDEWIKEGTHGRVA